MKKLNRILKSVLTLALALSASMAIAAQDETQKVYLSGTGSDNTVEWDFKVTSGMKSGKWEKIAVPSCWEQQGFGHYNYGHDPLDKRVNESGYYKYSFDVPKDWKGKAVRIVFEGVMTDAEVKINGKLIGEKHQGAFYEFKYDVEKYLKFGGKNLLEVKVDKASSNESINHAERKADFWVFGGIYRPVYLELMPKDHIERVAIDAKADGALAVDVFTFSKAGKNVSLKLKDTKGNLVADLKPSSKLQTADKWSLKSQANGIKTWSAEKPNLYDLEVSLLDSKGRALHTLSTRIGFRTIEYLESDGIYVNGERIKFKGVNRHSFHPETGRTTNRTLNLTHAQMIKDMNMNAVRMSHYPPDVNFLDICDSIGLFVIDEVCTWHTPKLDTEVGRKIVRETVIRDVNHPSILLWANGNETGWNTELDGDYEIWDIQKRAVIHPWNVFGKFNTLHYPLYSGIMNDARSQDRIQFHTEFLHGLYDGGHGAGLQDFWDFHWNYPLGAGGFLWCFADEGLLRTDTGKLDTDGNHAADGIVGPYLEKEASYFTIKEIWSPIYIEDRFIRDDFNGKFRVENRYHFTNLDECSMLAKWVKYSGADEQKKTSVMAQSTVQLPALKPAEKGTFMVTKPQNWMEADALLLCAKDAYGREIFTWSYPVKSPAKLSGELIKYPNSGTVQKTQNENEIKLTSGKMEYRFNPLNGRIMSVKRSGKLIPLSDGPMMLDQEKVVQQKVEQILSEEVEGGLKLTFVFEKMLQPAEWVTRKTKNSDTIQWTVHSNGLLDMRAVQKTRKKVTGYKGISFKFPEEQVKGMKWLGDGPYRVWRNRMKGTAFKVWENDYNNTITGESGFVYPEFKGFFSSLYWADLIGKNDEGFKVYCKTPHIFLRVFTPAKPVDFRRGNPVLDRFPAGDISFVLNIPAMATKFQEPEQTGPHGALEAYNGNYDEPIEIDLTFDFN